MKIHEFYQKYANLPFAKRFIPLDFYSTGMLTLHGVYEQMNELEDRMRPDRIRQAELLRIAEKGMESLSPSAHKTDNARNYKGDKI